MFQKMINGYIFYFLGQLFSGQLFELFARETNLKKQSSVRGVVKRGTAPGIWQVSKPYSNHGELPGAVPLGDWLEKKKFHL